MNTTLQPQTHLHRVELKPKDYKHETTSFWCAGCGHYGVLTGLLRALSEIGVDPNYLVSVSGIGCSSRLPYFVNSYKMHTLHGRAGPVATGIHLARPDLAVVVSGGDGDGFSIGGGHMPHLARKNINMFTFSVWFQNTPASVRCTSCLPSPGRTRRRDLTRAVESAAPEGV